jgi:hypothetical protein
MSSALAESTAPRSLGARRLFVFRCIELGWFVVRAVVLSPQLVIAMGLGLGVLRGAQIVSLLLAATQVALLGSLAAEVGARPAAGPLRVTIGLGIVGLVVSALGLVARLGGLNLLLVPGEHGYVITVSFYVALYMAFDVALWITLARLLGDAMTRPLHAAFFSLRFADAALSVLGAVFMGAFRAGGLAQLDMWLGTALRVAWCAVVLVALHLLSQRASTVEASGAPEPASAPSGKTDLVVGGVWLGGGLLVTLASYSSASGSGRYVITTGAIAVGIARIFRGLMRLSRGGR